MKKTINSVFAILLVFSLIFSMAAICVAEETEKKPDLGIDPSVLVDPDALYAEGMKYFTDEINSVHLLMDSGTPSHV